MSNKYTNCYAAQWRTLNDVFQKKSFFVNNEKRGKFLFNPLYSGMYANMFNNVFIQLRETVCLMILSSTRFNIDHDTMKKENKFLSVYLKLLMLRIATSKIFFKFSIITPKVISITFCLLNEPDLNAEYYFNVIHPKKK